MSAEDDVEISFSHATERERHVGLELPVAAAAAATGMPVAPLVGDLGVGSVQAGRLPVGRPAAPGAAGSSRSSSGS